MQYAYRTSSYIVHAVEEINQIAKASVDIGFDDRTILTIIIVIVLATLLLVVVVGIVIFALDFLVFLSFFFSLLGFVLIVELDC